MHTSLVDTSKIRDFLLDKMTNFRQNKNKEILKYQPFRCLIEEAGKYKTKQIRIKKNNTFFTF